MTSWWILLKGHHSLSTLHDFCEHRIEKPQAWKFAFFQVKILIHVSTYLFMYTPMNMYICLYLCMHAFMMLIGSQAFWSWDKFTFWMWLVVMKVFSFLSFGTLTHSPFTVQRFWAYSTWVVYPPNFSKNSHIWMTTKMVVMVEPLLLIRPLWMWNLTTPRTASAFTSILYHSHLLHMVWWELNHPPSMQRRR